MKPNKIFLHLPKSFWANVRLVSQQVGYTVRGEGKVKSPTISEIVTALRDIGFDASHVIDKRNQPTKFGKSLSEYFEYRAHVLNTFVEPRLMNADRARQVFDELYTDLVPNCPIPMNKQKGDKKVPAYMTAMVNMLVEANAKGLPCDYDPRRLITITSDDGVPLRTFARRVDGAFTSTINPIAMWEIKEYYHSTTFGSRVADGVYETLLDGMELEELREHEGIDVKHYLMIDAHYTWWDQGRSYLCRIVDMLHMGFVDEVLFGYEVVERLPTIVKEWVKIAHGRVVGQSMTELQRSQPH